MPAVLPAYLRVVNALTPVMRGLPGVIVTDCGWDVIVGAEHEEATVTVAVELLTDPQELVTRTQ